jgi:formylglycine-generating enzyme required for sulfatase activity
MILVEGEYCPEVHHRCVSYADPEGSALHGQRCARFKEPPLCLSPERERMRYCIDSVEFVAPDQALPQNSVTFAEASEACASLGKRLCTESEWTFACEGETLRAYPYGFARDSSACNADRKELVTPDGQLRDLRSKPGQYPRCTSVFGVLDLTGNLEEYVVADGTTAKPLRKGAYWQPAANHCRASQPHPDAAHSGVEVGFRCCAEASED